MLFILQPYQMVLIFLKRVTLSVSCQTLKFVIGAVQLVTGVYVPGVIHNLLCRLKLNLSLGSAIALLEKYLPHACIIFPW